MTGRSGRKKPTTEHDDAIHGDCEGQQGFRGRRAAEHELLAAMGKFNEELVKAGMMLAGEGLHPTRRARG